MLRILSTKRLFSSMKNHTFETLLIENPSPFVAHVQLNRPEQLNSMNQTFWRECKECFSGLAEDEDCRAIVVSGSGKHFTAGLDLTDMGNLSEQFSSDDDIARKSKRLYKIIRAYQESFSAIEQCPKPVIAAVHSACIGGGVDLITAADIRFCTKDAYFCVKEVDIGLAADVGTLQRLPKVIGSDSLARDLALTARRMYADEAKESGLVSRLFDDKTSMIQYALDVAKLIASKSPVAVQGTKIHMNYSRNHTIEESLQFMAVWNATMLQSEDLMKAAMAMATRSKENPTFSKL
ncbi:delta(3,5)-Delta(2,4)-dienoyl-CoA isomerase, mitochondrial-like [Artemia franciscana]|uniref:delta(3,5)-Delta(2,4)-dienoyl-CoA isomerase, mitochondrial-like n=1 Tax=Artemia franciscana TaxID=6661 RepID=UPI0032DA4329